MSISHSNIANIQLPMFSLRIRSRGAFLQSLEAGTGTSPTEMCRGAWIKTYNSVHCGDRKLCAMLRQCPCVARCRYMESASCKTFWKYSTTEPVLCDFTQLDDLQTAVFQFEIVVTFEEIAVICEREPQFGLVVVFLVK